MRRFPDTLRAELVRNKTTAEVLSKLDINNNAQMMWTFLYSKTYVQELSTLLNDTENEDEFKSNFEKHLKFFKDNLVVVFKAASKVLVHSNDSLAECIYNHTLAQANPENRHYLKAAVQRKDTVETDGGFSDTKPHHKSHFSILSEESSGEKIFHLKVPSRGPVIASNRAKNQMNTSYLQQIHRFPPDHQKHQMLYASEKSQNTLHSPSFGSNLPNIEQRSTQNQTQRRTHHQRFQSEFNHVKGAVKFNQSQRKGFMREKNDSPGPGNYSFDMALSTVSKKAPIVAIGRAPRITTLGFTGITESPGPGGYYPSMHLVLK